MTMLQRTPASLRATNVSSSSSAARFAPFVATPRSLRRAPVATRAVENETSTSKAEAKEDVPIWVRREKERELQEGAKPALPWGLYLLGSTFTAIAAVGCIFEYVDKNPFFGVISPENPLWAPILLTLAVTGFPSAGFLFYKGVTGFNEAAELQDKIDGYLDK